MLAVAVAFVISFGHVDREARSRILTNRLRDQKLPVHQHNRSAILTACPGLWRYLQLGDNVAGGPQNGSQIRFGVGAEPVHPASCASQPTCPEDRKSVV